MMSDCIISKRGFDVLPWEQKELIAKSVVKDVERIAKDMGVSEEVVFEFYRRKVFDDYDYQKRNG